VTDSHTARLVYLDTCALLAWAASRLTNPHEDDIATAGYIEGHLATRQAHVSEITLIEFYDNVALWHRRGDNGANRAWIDGVVGQVMNWLGSESLVVLPMAPKVFERSMRYVRMNVSAGKYKFRSMDAAHLVHVVDLARRTGSQVDLVTIDSDFGKLFGRLPTLEVFAALVDPRSALAETQSPDRHKDLGDTTG